MQTPSQSTRISLIFAPSSASCVDKSPFDSLRISVSSQHFKLVIAVKCVVVSLDSRIETTPTGATDVFIRYIF